MSAILLSPWALLGGAVIGALLGLFAPQADYFLHPVVILYLSLLKMVVLPFMVAAIILGIRKMLQGENVARYVQRITLVFFLGLLASAVLGMSMAMLVGPGRDLSDDKLAAFGKMIEKHGGAATEFAVSLSAPPQVREADVGERIVKALVPSNFFEALGKGASLQILVFSIFFGIAFGWLAEKHHNTLSDILDTVYRASHQLINWFNLLIPFVIAAVVCSVFSSGQTAALLAMIKFIASVGLLSLTFAVLAALLIMRRAGVSIRRFLPVFKETLVLAAATASTTACVPNTIAAMQKLGFRRDAVELVTPLGAVLFRPQLAFYFAYATVFIGQIYGRPLDGVVLATIVVGALAAALSSAGASGAVKVSFIAMTCEFVGFPFEAIFILFLVAEELCDSPRELFGVLSNAAATSLIAGAPSPGVAVAES
jgi:proton glutamate symport protein